MKISYTRLIPELLEFLRPCADLHHVPVIQDRESEDLDSPTEGFSDNGRAPHAIILIYHGPN